MDASEIEKLTGEYGEGWGYPHVCRVLKLVQVIGVGYTYDHQVVWYAAHLHDWGAFPGYRLAGVDHALRSRQVAEAEILPYTGLLPGQIAAVLEAIELHDYRNPQVPHNFEGLLLREADSLDLLGVIGIAREFAWGPNDLRKCLSRVLSRMEAIRDKLTLPGAVDLAGRRLAEMEQYIHLLEEESFGFL